MPRDIPTQVVVGALNTRWFPRGCSPQEDCPESATDEMRKLTPRYRDFIGLNGARESNSRARLSEPVEALNVCLDELDGLREALERTREQLYLQRIKVRHERVLARYRSLPR